MLHSAPCIPTCKRRWAMHISEARRNKPLSNGSFGPAAAVGYVKYYVRAFPRSTMSIVLELTDGIGILAHPRTFFILMKCSR